MQPLATSVRLTGADGRGCNRAHVTRWLNYLRAMWLFATHTGYCRTPYWGPDDAVVLTRFLETTTGAKLRMHLAAQIARMNEHAALNATPWECGMACGYKAFWAVFQYLSHAGAEPGTTEDAAPGVDADLDSYRP